MDSLKQQEALGIISLRYFDASGFSTTSSIPYGWQPVGETHRIPCHRSKRLNILGFMGLNNELFFHAAEQTVTAETVITAFDAFAEQYYLTEFQQPRKICFIVMDNASIHRTQAFKDKTDDWLLLGVHPHFIPPYCPELNLIEILWRKIKYEWLTMDAYQSYAHLKVEVVEALQRFGSELRITFA
jgi:transposase